MTHKAKRTRNRIDTQGVIEVRVLTDIAFPTILRGVSRDISAAGVFVLCDEQPPMGTKVRTKLTLPTTGMTLNNHGTIVRLEPEGFAIQFYEVLPSEKNPAN